MEENIVSSVKTTEAADGARLEQIAPEKPPVSGGRKAGLIVGIVVGVLALAYIAACAVVQFLYNDTALPHTDVLGVTCRDRLPSRSKRCGSSRASGSSMTPP